MTAIPAVERAAPVIVATGPLTSDALSADIARARRRRASVFLRRDQPDRAGRDDRSRRRCSARRDGTGASGSRLAVTASGSAGSDRSQPPGRPAASTTGEGDYLNCPLTRDGVRARSTTRWSHAESATVHDFDKETFFEGCLPIEVMAHRGRRHAALRADEAGRPDRSAHRPARRTPPCSCVRTTSPAITSAWSASRRRSNGASRRACCG